MDANRDGAGRFVSGVSPATPPFNLLDSLQRLFTTAERSNDVAGCASLARVIRDLTPEPPAPNPADVDFDSWTEGEQAELSALTEQFCALKARVALRRAGGVKNPVHDAPRSTISAPVDEDAPEDPNDTSEVIL